MTTLKDIFRKKQAYHSVSDMLMYDFIAIICGKQKEPKNWDDLFNEYQSLLKEEKSDTVLYLLKDISYNQNKIFIIQSLCYALSLRYSKDIADELRSINPRFKYENNDKLNKELQLTMSQAKALSALVKNKKEELKRIQSGHKQPKLTDWDSQFVYLTKFMGVKMNAKNTTVSEYCNAINLIKEANKTDKNGK